LFLISRSQRLGRNGSAQPQEENLIKKVRGNRWVRLEYSAADGSFTIRRNSGALFTFTGLTPDADGSFYISFDYAYANGGYTGSPYFGIYLGYT
jgi:hypothetical protein